MKTAWRMLTCTGPGGRGCSCEYHTAARIYSTECARKVRQRRLDEANRNAGRVCQKRYGTGKCGGILETVTRDGATVVTCPWCERQRQRICRDCPRPVEGNGPLRCAEHKDAARREQIRRYTSRNREKVRARARAAYRDPSVRRRRNEYKKAYRKAHPDKVREWKRQYTQKHGSNRGSRYLEYHRQYNAQTTRQERKREQAREAYYRDNPVRPSPRCQHCKNPIDWAPKPGGAAGRPPINCDRCCTPTELKRRIARRAAIEAATPIALVETPAPEFRVQRPMPARYAPTGERLCVTPDCDRVVTHRKKKCSRCRQAEVELAKQKLEAHHGRGRRTDLGGEKPKAKPGPKPRATIVAAVPQKPSRSRKPAAAPSWSPWNERLDRGLTTWQMAEELEISEPDVREKLRLAGGDLLGRAYANNTAAEKLKRSTRAASTWAKPREVAVA